MGKFGDTKKRKLVDDGDEDDPELDAEIAAVMATRARLLENQNLLEDAEKLFTKSLNALRVRLSIII